MNTTNKAILIMFPLAIVCVLVVIVPWISGTLTGWKDLAAIYPSSEEIPNEKVWHRISVPNLTLRNFMTVAMDDKGMFFAWPFWFRMGNPPIHVPWEEIQVEESKILFRNTVKLCFKRARTSLHFYPEDVMRFKAAAGKSWPGVLPSSP